MLLLASSRPAEYHVLQTFRLLGRQLSSRKRKHKIVIPKHVWGCKPRRHQSFDIENPE